mmetsp:Transcript_3982/g.6215  ORF Transcript_3982/g.6215 Transcript_3982/m.6215 type:complete len:151 (+) Transcript_3982:97-549(+)
MEFTSGLFDAVAKGDAKCVLHALDIEKSVDAVDENGCTVLHWASVSKESEKIIPALVAVGAKINVTDITGRTPLHYLCAKGRVYGAACLLHYGADVNVPGGEDDSTPLHYAAASGSDDLVRLLLAYGASITVTNKHGLYPQDLNQTNVYL